MKKTLAVAALLAGAVSGYSQDQVGWSDYNNTDFQITIWSPQIGANAPIQLNGNSPGTFGTGRLPTGPDIPSGTQTGYTGVPLGGSGAGVTSPTDYANGNLWSVQLYAGPTGSPLAPVAGAIANMYTSAGNQGLYNVVGNPVVTIPGVPSGAAADFQLTAWYNGGGSIGSYDASVALGINGINGASTIGTEAIGGGPLFPPDLPGPGNPGVTGGITSFNVTAFPNNSGPPPVPEPCTIALALIGASAFLRHLPGFKK
jgi:hypothetical protein